MASTRKKSNMAKAWRLDECDERSCRCKWRLCCSRIGLEQYYQIQQNSVLGIFLYCGTTRRNFSKPHDKEEILIAEVDLDLQENVRQNWPFFRDRRIDALEILQKSD
jgi:hypothetical protein